MYLFAGKGILRLGQQQLKYLTQQTNIYSKPTTKILKEDAKSVKS